jgi:hypothetical protein
MKVQKLFFGDTEIPAPADGGVKFRNDKIWSDNTGRSSNCVMVGDIKAIKKTVSLQWFGLTGEQVELINSFISNVSRPFFSVTMYDEAYNVRTFNVYAGTPTYEVWGWDERRQLCKGLAVDLVEQ